MVLSFVPLWTSLHPIFFARTKLYHYMGLENKFHAYFYSGTGEKKLIDLTSMRLRNNESNSEFI